MKFSELERLGGPVYPVTVLTTVKKGEHRHSGLVGITLLDYVAVRMFRLYLEKGINYEMSAKLAYQAAQEFLKVRSRYLEEE